MERSLLERLLRSSRERTSRPSVRLSAASGSLLPFAPTQNINYQLLRAGSWSSRRHKIPNRRQINAGPDPGMSITDPWRRCCGKARGEIMRPGRGGSESCLWNVLKIRSFPVLGFCDRRKLRLGEAKTAPKEENPNPKDRRKAIGCILAWCRVPKWKSRLS